MFALAFAALALTTVCSQSTNHPAAFGQLSEAEFRQPLPEPPLQQSARTPSASNLLAKIAASSLQTAEFQIVGTEPAPRPQGQIGAEVYRQAGKLEIKSRALEIQPLDEYPGQNPNIDGRGNYVVIDSTVYKRGSTLSEWQLSSIGDLDVASFAYISPATWASMSGGRVLGESSINGSSTWVIEGADEIGRQFRAWIRESDGYPLRYTTSYVNVKGRTYYINALYQRFNTQLAISPPLQSNHGIARIGEPVKLDSGSVTVTDVAFDCLGTAIRRPAPKDKFVTIALTFSDVGPDSLSITPEAWRLYGDGTNGASAIDAGNSSALVPQLVETGVRVSGFVTFEVAEDAYQLITVGKFPDVTAVVSVYLPIYPNGQPPCSHPDG